MIYIDDECTKIKKFGFCFFIKNGKKKPVETFETQCKFRESFTLSKWFKKLSLKYCMWCILCICNSKKVAFFTLIFLFKKAKSCFLVCFFLLTKFCKIPTVVQL